MVTDDYNPSSWEVEAGGFEPSSAIQTLRPARPVSKAPSTHREGLFHSWFRNPSSYVACSSAPASKFFPI